MGLELYMEHLGFDGLDTLKRADFQTLYQIVRKISNHYIPKPGISPYRAYHNYDGLSTPFIYRCLMGVSHIETKGRGWGRV